METEDERNERMIEESSLGTIGAKLLRARGGLYRVTFTGFGEDYTVPIPLEDLSESPWVCSEDDDGGFHHWVQDGFPHERHYRYAGLCGDTMGPHTYPGWLGPPAHGVNAGYAGDHEKHQEDEGEPEHALDHGPDAEHGQGDQHGDQ